MTPAELLQRLHNVADNAIYSAEVECNVITGRGYEQCKFPDRPCPFRIETNIPGIKGCKLPALRALLGDHYSTKPERYLPQEILKGIQFINDALMGPDKK